MKPLFSKEVDLTNPGDYQNHTTELLIPELEPGFYFIIMASNEDYSDNKSAFAFMPLWVTDITYQSRSMNEKSQIMVSNRTTGFPMAGAKVNVSYQEYNYKLRYYENKSIGTFTADENGIIEYPHADEYRTYMISVSHNGQTYAPNQGIYDYNYYYYNNYNEDYVTYFFTDRKIYRPGQTIYYKGFASNMMTKREV